MVTLFLSLPLPDDGGRLVRHHFGEATEMICPLRKARGWVQCPAWAKSKGRSGRQCAMPGNADLLDCQGQPQPPPLRSGKHATIAQQESGRILSSIWRQVVGAIPTGGPRQLRRMFADCAGGASYGDFKSGDPPPSNGDRKNEQKQKLLGDFRSRGGPYFRGRGGEFCVGTRKCKMGSVRPGAD